MIKVSKADKAALQKLLQSIPSLKGLHILTPQERAKRAAKVSAKKYRTEHAQELKAKRAENKQYHVRYYQEHKQRILQQQRSSYARQQGRLRKYAECLRRQGYVVVSPKDLETLSTSDVLLKIMEESKL